MRISDWSSDVCSSDLVRIVQPLRKPDPDGFRPHPAHLLPVADDLRRSRDRHVLLIAGIGIGEVHTSVTLHLLRLVGTGAGEDPQLPQIGRASWRERVCQYV